MKSLLTISRTFALYIRIVIDQDKCLLINIDTFIVPDQNVCNVYFKDDLKGLYI